MGKKTGWQNDYPPGWDQKSDNEKQYWKDQVQKGRERISKAAKNKGMSEEEAKSAADDFDKAARKGLDPNKSESLVKDKIKAKKKKKENLNAKGKGKGKGNGKGNGKGKK